MNSNIKEDISDLILNGENLLAKNDYFQAHAILKNALTKSRKAQYSEGIQKCKILLAKVNKLMKEKMNSFSVGQSMPKKDVDNFVGNFLKYNGNKLFMEIGLDPLIAISYEFIVQISEPPISYQLANLCTISDDGHMVRGGSDPNHVSFMQSYRIAQGLVENVYLYILFQKLIKNNKFVTKKLIKFLKYSGSLPDDELLMIKYGIDRYLKKDFISAIHILVPQIEKFIIILSEKSGINVVALGNGQDLSTNTLTVGIPYLDSPQIVELFGKNFVEHVKFILFDPLGYKLRHKVAHGAITMNECSEKKCNLIICLIIELFASYARNNGIKVNKNP